MVLDKEQIRTLEKLCRIRCTPEEEENFLQDLQNILKYVAQLQTIDTDNVTSSEHILSHIQANVFREDKPEVTLPREEFLANAPDQIGGMIRVFPVMKPNE